MNTPEAKKTGPSSSPAGFVEKNSSRITLQEHIPLRYPLALTIEPTNKCNYACRFCPNGDGEYLRKLDKPRGHMTLKLFTKIINDLKSAGSTISSLALHKDGEPLLNRHLPEMIAMAKESGIFKSVTVTTNGSLLTPRVSGALIESKLDYLRVSVSSIRSSRYQWLTNTKYQASRVYNNVVEFRRLRDNSSSKKPWIYVKMVSFPAVKEELDEFKQMYDSVADEVNIEHPMNWDGSRDFLKDVDKLKESDLKQVYGYYRTGNTSGYKICCPLPWYHMSINFNGRVGICGVDWAHRTIIGDVNNSHLIYEIWNGDRMQKFRKLHVFNKRNKNTACRNCTFLYSYPDNIDDFVALHPEKALGLVMY